MRPSTPAAGKFSSFYNLILQSLRGEETDYTQGSIRRAVILLAIPMMLEMIMESVFAVVDIFFVSHLGKHATSTVGLTESVITIVYSLAIGISMAATAVVARRVGEKDYAAANRAGMQAIILAIALTAVISVTGFLFAEEILELMGAEPETIREGKNYTRVLFGGSVVIMLLFLINGIFRGAGNAMMAMKSLWVANICNIILCPLLIRGLGPIPAFGVTGAAMATTIGRGVGVGYQLYHLNKGKGIIRINWRHLEPAWDIIRSLVKIAWPATLQFLVSWYTQDTVKLRPGTRLPYASLCSLSFLPGASATRRLPWWVKT